MTNHHARGIGLGTTVLSFLFCLRPRAEGGVTLATFPIGHGTAPLAVCALLPTRDARVASLVGPQLEGPGQEAAEVVTAGAPVQGGRAKPVVWAADPA